MIVERGEKRHAEAAVGQCVQQAVAGRSQKEIGPEGETTEAGSGSSNSQGHDRSGQQSREHERMSESPVTPKISISDAKPESDDIKVGNDGTKRANGENPLGTAKSVESRADTESRDCM